MPTYKYALIREYGDVTRDIQSDEFPDGKVSKLSLCEEMNLLGQQGYKLQTSVYNYDTRETQHTFMKE